MCHHDRALRGFPKQKFVVPPLVPQRLIPDFPQARLCRRDRLATCAARYLLRKLSFRVAHGPSGEAVLHQVSDPRFGGDAARRAIPPKIVLRPPPSFSASASAKVRRGRGERTRTRTRKKENRPTGKLATDIRATCISPERCRSFTLFLPANI